MTAALPLLGALDLPEADAAGLAHAHDEVWRAAGLRSWVTDRVAELGAVMGEPSPQEHLLPRLVAQPEASPPTQQYLSLVVVAEALPQLKSFAAERGIPDSVLAATLADVGRNVRKNRAWFAQPGLGEELTGWCVRHLHGAIFQLGRLQLERVRLGATAGLIRATGQPAREGEPALSVHIPSGLGPMTPAACDESLERARSFFAERFPGEQPRYGLCFSWLLDAQLRDYLPPASNILQFQRRFSVTAMGEGGAEADISTRRFVFGEAITPLDQQPRRSSLERGVHAHLEAGRHFRHGRGWFAL